MTAVFAVDGASRWITDQTLLHRGVTEKRGVRKGNAIKLSFDRVDNLWMTVAQTGNCGATRSVEVLSPITLKDVRTLPAHYDWKLGMGVPMKHVR